MSTSYTQPFTIDLTLVQRFQKEAILRQMQEYKRERTNLEAQLNAVAKSALYHDEHLMIVDASFTQVSKTPYPKYDTRYWVLILPCVARR